MKKIFGLFICLINAGFLKAQDSQADLLKHQFQDYQSLNFQEKLFVHTDKTFYLAGETVWFKVYAVDASFHKPIDISRITYIEIINKESKPVLQTKIAMLHGSGSGSLSISGNLPSGNYIFRAYTSWMKNFSSEFFFEQNIQIVNTLKSPAIGVIQKSLASIRFFPEGGDEVGGIQQIIAFKVTGPDGLGINCEGMIVNQQNDTILKIQTLHDGMGKFRFTPDLNASYFALVQLKDTIIKQKLPEAVDHGFVMYVREEESGKLMVNIKSSHEFLNTPVYLFTQTRQRVKNIQTNLIREGEANFVIDKKELEDGISVITLFNNLRQPVCERLVFKRPTEKNMIRLQSDKDVYQIRAPVNIRFFADAGTTPQFSGNYSMSVFMIDSLQHIPEQNIFSYLYLSSELKGSIESPEYYFSNEDKSGKEAIDNLLLTQGWRRFKWHDLLENKKPYFEFLPEMEGVVVNGKIVNKITGAPVAATGAYLSIPGANHAFSSATSDAQGMIHFGFKNVYKSNAVVIQPALLKDSNNRIDIVSAFSDKYNTYSERPFILGKNLERSLVGRSISNQVENTYSIAKKHKYISNDMDTSAFYGKPDKEYILDNYTRFQTLEEVLREYVEDLRIRKEGNKFTFRVRNQLFGTYFQEDPLILLDGIPVSDASRVVALDPLKIYKIELVRHNYNIGSSQFAGIVNFRSFYGDLGSAQIDPNALVIEYEGLQNRREFFSPVYATNDQQNSHLPDFRNVLYWAPQIITEGDGKSSLSFYTSDIKGKFAVFIQGISSDGAPAKAISYFEVRDLE